MNSDVQEESAVRGEISKRLSVCPPSRCAAARQPTPAEMDRFRGLMQAYAREPLSWPRRLRYGLGRLVAGRRPFAPYLDRERWELEVRRRAA